MQYLTGAQARERRAAIDASSDSIASSCDPSDSRLTGSGGSTCEQRQPLPTAGTKRMISRGISQAGEFWKYQFAVRSEKAPLTDVLVIVIRAADGRIVSRLSGKL